MIANHALYFAHLGFTEFYWVSSPDAAHSRNIAVRPDGLSLAVLAVTDTD